MVMDGTSLARESCPTSRSRNPACFDATRYGDPAEITHDADFDFR